MKQINKQTFIEPNKANFFEGESLTLIAFDDQDFMKNVRMLINHMMITICGSTLLKPLSTISNNYVSSINLLCVWKKSDVIPKHIENNKQFT